MSEAELQARIDVLERALNESQQTVRALMRGEIDTLVTGDSSPVLLQAAQEQLLASEQKLRAVFDGSLDGLIIADTTGQFIDANLAACMLIGSTRDALIGRSMREFVEPDIDIAATLAKLAADGHAQGQLRLRRSDGAIRDIEFSSTANIQPGVNLTVLRDLTEQHRAERRFRTMIEKSHDGIALLDATGRNIYASPATERILGAPTSLVEGASSFDFVYQDDLERAGVFFGRVLASPGVPLNEALRVLHRDGALVWVDTTLTNFLADPAISAIIGNFRDVTEKRAADAALLASQRLLAEAQTIAHLGSWESNPRLDQPIFWTPECAAICGRDVEAPPTLDQFMQWTHPDDKAAVIAETERAIASDDFCVSDHRILRPDGEVRWVHTRTRIEGEVHWVGDITETRPDRRGRPYRAFGVIQDITEIRRVRDELGATAERYRRIIDSTSEGVWMYDSAGVTTFMNPRLATMLGYTPEEVVGQSVLTFMRPEAYPAAAERMALRKHGVAERGDFKLLRRDGSELWVSLHADPLYDQAGNVEGAIALLTDVSELRKADENRNLLASIVASSEDAILSRGVDGIIRTWNQGAERLTQYTAAEAVGRPIAMLYPPEDLARLDTARRVVDDGETLNQFEMLVVRKDGTHVEVSLTSSAMLDETGKVHGASIIARDISAQRLAEAGLRRSDDQLRQAQKLEALGSLAGGVAHDFNNLLSIVLSYTGMIIDDLDPADPLRLDLEEVHKAGLRATNLTRQLLAFGRKQILQPVVLGINDVLHDIEKMLRRLVSEDVTLTLLLSPHAGKVHADIGQIEQVVMNLVVNARDAMPEGGSLTIETANVVLDEDYVADHEGVIGGSYVMLAVSDTGIGMDAATQRRIFEPFFTTKDKFKGTGLGLSTVYGIVQQSGGHLWVYSEVGHGSTFKVYLPRTDRELDGPVEPLEDYSVRGGRETILLVEDEAQVRAVIRTILRKQGYQVLEASNGGEAFLVCEQFSKTISLLLTDVVMPLMNGRQLAERLGQLRPDMKVLFMSGYAEDTIVHQGVLEAGIQFISKPIMPTALLRKVRQVLDGTSRALARPILK